MASSVATPLERQFGRIAGVTQMTSSSNLGNTGIVLQFDLNRDINAAARDVEAAINAARSQLPADLPSQPSYRKVNTADSPVMFLSVTSDTIPISGIYDAVEFHPGAENCAGSGSRPGFRVGLFQSSGARRGESTIAEQLRNQPWKLFARRCRRRIRIRQKAPSRAKIAQLDNFGYGSAF